MSEKKLLIVSAAVLAVGCALSGAVALLGAADAVAISGFLQGVIG